VTDRAPNLGDGLADLIASFYTQERVEELLGLTAEQVEEQCAAGLLLCLEPSDGGSRFYPTWIFETKDGQVRVKPDFQAVITALKDRSHWTTAVILRTPAHELEDMTPEEWVRERGDLDRLRSYAEKVNAEFER
jgi:hypothetical protein